MGTLDNSEIGRGGSEGQRRLKYRLARHKRARKPEAEAPPPAGATPPPIDLKPELEQAHRRISDLSRVIDEERAATTQFREKAREEILRLRADMEAQRKRHDRERDEMKKTAASDVFQRLMSPLDHLDLAVRSAATASEIGSVVQGLELILRELHQTLEQCGVERIDPLGQKFDPGFHEAIGTGNDPTKPAHEILEVVRAGYLLGGRVLRPAMVRVNTPVDEPAAAEK